jgi:hypothetical protein
MDKKHVTGMSEKAGVHCAQDMRSKRHDRQQETRMTLAPVPSSVGCFRTRASSVIKFGPLQIFCAINHPPRMKGRPLAS